jgi:hypothetical protein
MEKRMNYDENNFGKMKNIIKFQNDTILQNSSQFELRLYDGIVYF